MSMSYATQEGRLQFWLLRVLENLRHDLSDADFLSGLWEEIAIRFPEGYNLYGDELWHKTPEEIAADAMEELADYFIYSAALCDISTPEGQRG